MSKNCVDYIVSCHRLFFHFLMSGSKEDLPKVRTFSSAAETNELLESMMNYPGILEDSMGMVSRELYSCYKKPLC